MRILFLTNFYPPASRGGYEQWCQEVAEGLRSRSDHVVVLTSKFGREQLKHPEPVWIRRELHLEMEIASPRNILNFFVSRKTREKENIHQLRKIVEEFKPDFIMIWGMWNLHRSLPALAEKLMPGKTVYYMGDYWPTLPDQFEEYWKSPPRNFFASIPKLLLKPAAQAILSREKRQGLKFERMLFPSAFMEDEFKQKRIVLQHTKVIYGAIDTSPYLNLQKKPNVVLSLLYVGRLTHGKGVHTAIEAVRVLVHEHDFKDLKLTIIGNGEPDYEASLHALVKQENIESLVTFLPAQPKEALPALYQQADIFLFTSIWSEPFGRVIVEAMASELAVVGAPVGGAAEILVEGKNALTFIPADPASLARQLLRLIESPAYRLQLAKAGRETALNKFDIQRMTTQIKTYLETLVKP